MIEALQKALSRTDVDIEAVSIILDKINTMVKKNPSYAHQILNRSAIDRDFHEKLRLGKFLLLCKGNPAAYGIVLEFSRLLMPVFETLN